MKFREFLSSLISKNTQQLQQAQGVLSPKSDLIKVVRIWAHYEHALMSF